MTENPADIVHRGREEYKDKTRLWRQLEGQTAVLAVTLPAVASVVRDAVKVAVPAENWLAWLPSKPAAKERVQHAQLPSTA